METKLGDQTFGSEFFKMFLEQEAWILISRTHDIPFTEALIDKYIDKWDWKELSSNVAVRWNEHLIEKYKNKIDWPNLTMNVFVGNYSFTPYINIDLIRKFENSWDWSILSDRIPMLPLPIMQEFVHRWDWNKLIYSRHIDWDNELFVLFKDYIQIKDLGEFRQSGLCRDLVEINKISMIAQMLAK